MTEKIISKFLDAKVQKGVYKYVRREYVNNVENMGFYKVLIPQANGNGSFGEIISQPVIEGPMVGNTETFISIGKFKDMIRLQMLSRNMTKPLPCPLVS